MSLENRRSPSAAAVRSPLMRIFLARFLLPAVIVTGVVLAFGSTTSDPPDARRAEAAVVHFEQDHAQRALHRSA